MINLRRTKNDVNFLFFWQFASHFYSQNESGKPCGNPTLQLFHHYMNIFEANHSMNEIKKQNPK